MIHLEETVVLCWGKLGTPLGDAITPGVQKKLQDGYEYWPSNVVACCQLARLASRAGKALQPTSDFDDDDAWDAIAANVNIDEQLLISRATASSGSPSQHVSVLTSRIQQLDEQVRCSLFNLIQFNLI